MLENDNNFYSDSFKSTLTNKNLLQGILLVGIATFFLYQAMKLPFGTFVRAGPGLFPIVIGSMLFLIAIAILVKAFLIPSEKIQFKFKGITIITVSLILFASISEHFNMLTGIIAMVLCSSFASSNFNILRSLKIGASLALIAYGMQRLFGFQLPLF
jgi:hypothetical protein